MLKFIASDLAIFTDLKFPTLVETDRFYRHIWRILQRLSESYFFLSFRNEDFGMDSCLENQILDHSKKTEICLKSESKDSSDESEVRRRIDVSLRKLQSDLAGLEAHLIQIGRQKREELNLKSLASQRIQKLEDQSTRINLLSYWLEMELFKFDEFAKQASEVYEAAQKKTTLENGETFSNQYRASNIWEIGCSAVPMIVKQESQFLLTSRTIDFSGIEP